jgi:hypothetical protein
MKRFKEFITERLKDEHEPIIRALSSLGRADYMRKQNKYVNSGFLDIAHGKEKHNARSHYGDCDFVSHHIADRLRHTYPSVKIKYSHRFGHALPEDPKGEDGLTGHSWVEIPETGHYVDGSHDMFRIHGNRDSIKTVKGRFHNKAIHIGKIGDEHYEKHYSDKDRIVYHDDHWVPGYQTKNKDSNR